MRMVFIAVLGLSIFLAPARGNATEEGALSAEPDATGQSVAVPTARTGEGIAAPALSSKPFRVAVTLDHSVGSGTFVKDYYAYVAARIGITPSYAFQLSGVKLLASGRISGSYEYTPPDNPTGRRLSWDDVGLDLSAPRFFVDEKRTGIALSADVGATIPISLQSIWSSAITGLSGGVSGSRRWGKLTLLGRLGASKTLFASLDRRVPQGLAGQRDAQDHALYICRSDPHGCLIAADRVPPLWSMGGGLNAAYAPTGKLEFSIAWGLGKTFQYPVAVDELSTRAVYSDGTPVARAQGQSDRMVGAFGARYRLTEAISASLEVGTIQPPLTADGKAVRFPFFAFRNVEDSFTSYSLAFSGAY